jgi:cytochrome c-type protein NapB
VPHPIDPKGVAACLQCHRHGIVLEGRVAPAMSHEPLPSCTQCHAPAPELDNPVTPAVVVANGFVGQAAADRGERAWQGAPPAIPHPTWMRQRCASCHGVTGPKGLRTTHPERRNCAQCHSAESFSPMP